MDALEYLVIDGNSISGELPGELENLVNMKAIWLSNNPLSPYELPKWFLDMPNLEGFGLDRTNLRGELPAWIGDMSRLQQIWVEGNDMSGELPKELSKASIQFLKMADNHFSGPIPPELGNAVSLSGIWLGENNLSGPIPKELGNLRVLQDLYLNDNQLSGEIPKELGNLTLMEFLDLRGNELSGEIPIELGNMTRTFLIHLARNNLTGPIPPELFASFGRLEGLWLEGNNLTGEIPEEIGDIASMYAISLSRNQLTGTVPDMFANLSGLSGLFLDHNMLTGELPESLIYAPNLVYLWFNGQELCAPTDDLFQGWLQTIPDEVRGLNCGAGLLFMSGIDDQIYTAGEAIADLRFPEADGGVVPYVYTLSPTLPADLEFDAVTRILSGTPTEATERTIYVYKAEDAVGAAVESTFAIEVIPYTGVARSEGLPEDFRLTGNFPNPFEVDTEVEFDLPLAAVVSLEVFDLLGRQVYSSQPRVFEPGIGLSLTVGGFEQMSPGVYLYRMLARMPEVQRILTGHMIFAK